MKPSNPSATEPSNPKHAVHGPLRRKADELVLADVDAAERLVVPAAEIEANAQAAIPAEAALPADDEAPASEVRADAMADADVGADGLQVAQASAGDGGTGAGAGAAGAGAGAGAAGAAGAAAGAAGAAGIATATAIGAGALVSAGFVLPAALAAAAGTVALASGSSGSDSHVASAPPAAAATAPTTTVSAIDISADTGNSASDFVTSQSAQTVTAQLSAALASGEDLWGSVDHGATWVRITDKVHGTAVAWDGVTLVAGGAIEFEVRNATGTGPAASHAYTLDTSVAAATIALAADSGISAVDHVTNHATLSIGNVEAGGVVQYSIDGGTTWTSGFAAIEGVNDVQVRVTDVAGNVSAATSFGFTLDTSVAAPTVALVAERSGTAGTGEHVTDQGTLNVGNLEAGAVVQYSIDGGATWLSSFTAVEGSNNLQVRTVDVAGNVSAATPFSFTLDTSVPDTSRPDTILNGTVTAGPVIEGNGLHVVAYRSDGTVLVDGEVSAVGTFTLNVPGSYTGAVLVMVFDTSAGADYFDEATGKPKDLGSDLRAATVIPAPGTYHVNINALTELAVRSLGLAGGTDGSAGFDLSHFDPAQITAANQAVAAALGLGGQDLVTGPAPHAIIDANGAGNPDVDDYGRLLAALSGAELDSGSLDAALKSLGAQMENGGLSSAGLALLVAGAAKVGTALVDSVSQITSHATGVAITSVADDNTVNAAEAAGVVTVGGTCAAGATVTLLVGDHTVVVTVVGTTWTVALGAGELAQLGQGAVVLQATATLDGTAQVAFRGIYIDTVLPGTPTLLAHDTTDATPLLTGSADAGTTLAVSVGGAVFVVAVDADGHWSLDTRTATPASGTFDLGPDGLKNVTLTSTDAAGNTAAGAGSFALDTAAPAAPTVALATDSGTSATDRVTNSGALALGNVGAGATVEYSTDGGITWTTGFTPVEGVNDVRVRVTDALGNPGAATAFSFTLATQPPAAPSVALQEDSGASATDHVTNQGALALGNVSPGALVEYSTDGGATWTTGFAPVEGVNDVRVRATDVAGNQGPATAFSFTLATQPPAAPSVALHSDSGANPTDHVTNDATLDVGNVAAGGAVEYSTDGGATWTAGFAPVEGANDVQVRVTDAGGNHGAAAAFSFTLMTQPPAAPEVALVEDSGASATDKVTGNGALAIGAGTATVEYSTDGGTTWTASFTPVEGTNSVQVRAVDAAGNPGAATAFSFSLDTTAPADAPRLALQMDSGAEGDFVTSDATIVVGGLQPGEAAQYSTDGGVTWTSGFTPVEGANSVLVRAVDAAGNAGPQTSFAFTLDTATPAPSVALVTDSGASATDQVTAVGALAVAGLEAGATAQYSTDGGTTWTATFTPVDGTNSVLVRAVDAAGNASTAVPFNFTLDTTAPAVPTVALATDNGTSPTDHLTSLGTLAVTGLEPGATAQYSTDGGTTWTSLFAPAEGPNNVLVRSTDAAGNHSAGVPFSFTLDTTAPTSVPNVGLAVDSGTSNFDRITNTGTLAVTGLQAGESAQYSVDGGTTWTSSFTAASGTNVVTVRAVDAAGNAGPQTSFTFTLDTTAPAAPLVGLNLDSGTSSTDHITKYGSLFMPLNEAGATVQYSTDGGTTWTSAFAPVEGANSVLVRQTDAAGNHSSGTPFSFTLDTTPPTTIPAVSLAVDSGASNFDRVTNTGTLAIAGLQPGESVQYSADGGATWLTSFAAVPGTNVVMVRAVDAAGNFNPSTTSFTFTLDATAPAAPTVALATDSGASASDHVTTLGTLTIGTENSATKQYSIDGGTTWTATFTPVEGVNNVLVRQTDLAGNHSSATAFSFTLDTAAPAAPTVALATDSGASPTDHVTNVGTLALGNVETGAVAEYSTDGGTTWTQSFAPSQGANNVMVRATDAAGNHSASTSFSFTLDTTAPTSVPTVSLVLDTGTSNTDHITSVGTIAVTGLQTGETAQYSTDGGTTWTSSFTAGQGVNNLTVRAVDAAGNAGPQSTLSFTLDTSLPIPPSVALATDSGASATDLVTNSGTLALGNVETGGQVQYSADQTTWTTSFTAVEGSNNVYLRQVDAAGNQSLVVQFSFTLDTTAPTSAPSVSLVLDTGTSNSDHVTNTGTLAVSGLPSGATAQYSIDGGTTWTSSFTAASGLNVVAVRAVDTAGNTGPSTSFNFTLDATAPAAPSVALATDSGTSASDHVSKFGTLSVTNVESGAAVQYSIDSGTTWTSSFSAVEGQNSVLVRTSDSAGNHSTNVPLAFTLDTTIGSLQALSVPEAPNGIDDAEAASGGGVGIIVPFASGVVAGDVIKLRVVDPNTSQPIVYSHTATSAEVTAGHANLVVASADLSGTGAYVAHVTLTDAAGNESAERTASFTVLPGASEDTCELFNFARLDYIAENPSAGHAGSNVFVLTDGITTLPTDELGIYAHHDTLHVGADLGNTSVSGDVDAGGIALDYEIDMTGRTIVVGAAAVATADDEMIWLDRLQVEIDSTGDGTAAAYLVADAVGANQHHMAGAFDVAVSIEAAGTAHASGALVAHAGASTATLGGVAEVEACEVSIVAHGGSDARAYLGANPSQLGVAAISAVAASVGIAAVAHGQGNAVIGIHEDVHVSASAAGLADAGIFGILASDDGSVNAANAFADLGGDVTIEAHADGGNAHAHADGVIGAAAGTSSFARLQIDGNVTLAAHGGVNAIATMSAISADAYGTGSQARVEVGSLSLRTTADANIAQVSARGITASAESQGALAQVEIGGDVTYAAHGAGGALVTVVQMLALAHDSGTVARLHIGGNLHLSATADGGSAAVAFSTGMAASADHTSAHAALAVDGDIVLSAHGAYNAYLQMGHVGANACSVDSDANVTIGGGMNFSAVAADGVANVSVGALSIHASEASASAAFTVGGNLSIEAQGPDVATARFDGISADAASRSAVAMFSIAGGVSVRADSDSGSANIALEQVYARASASDAVAQVAIGGDLVASAEGAGAGAKARLQKLGAYAASSATGTMSVTGDVAVGAIAHAGKASATLSSVYALANGQAASARVEIGGNLGVSGTADQGRVSAVALNDLHAAATGTGAGAVLHIGGDVSLDSASPVLQANESAGNIYAKAAGDGAQANVTIDGAIRFAAHGATGASIDAHQISAHAIGAGAHAVFELGGNLSMQAFGVTSSTAIVKLGAVSAHAAATSAAAQLHIGGAVCLKAEGSGEATVSFSGVQAHAQAANANARLSIDDGITVLAHSLGDTATVKTHVFHASADGSNLLAQIEIGDDVTIMSHGHDAAFLHVSSDVGAAAAGSSATAIAHVAGNVFIQAVSGAGPAAVTVGNVDAQAGNASGAYANVDIDGNLHIESAGYQGANLSVGGVFAHANGSSNHAAFNVDGNLTVSATASAGAANVALGALSANAASTGDQALLSIGDDATVFAQGRTGARARIDTVFAHNGGSFSSLAQVQIGGSLAVTADAATGNAWASIGNIDIDSHITTSGASLARLDVGDDLTIGAAIVAAALGTSARATLGQIQIEAYVSGHATLTIGGNLDIAAHLAGHGSNSALASLTGGIRLKADQYSAEAQLSIAQDLKLDADAAYDGGDGIPTSASKLSAQAVMGNVRVSATHFYADANLSVGGNIDLHAHSDFNNGVANVYLGSVSAVAHNSYAEANVTIGGSLVGIADAGTGDDAVARTHLKGLGAESNAPQAVAVVHVAGNIEASAAVGGSAAAASATLSSLYAHATFHGVANIDVGGRIDVNATAGGLNAMANAKFASLVGEADASGQAAVSVGGPIEMLASAASGSASLQIGSLSAHASLGNADSVVSIGGPLDAHAIGGANASIDFRALAAQAEGQYDEATLHIAGNVHLTASADFASVMMQATSTITNTRAGLVAGADDSSAKARIQIDGDWLQQANGGSHANAMQGGLSAAIAAQYSAQAVVSIGGDFEVRAIAAAPTGTASAMLGQHFSYQTAQLGLAVRLQHGLVAYADNSSDIAQIMIEGDLTVAASGGGDARAALYSISAREASSATAEVSIGGTLAVTAQSDAGDARVDVYDVRAHWNTTATAGAARVSIDGGVHIEGTGGDGANVFAGIWSAFGSNAALNVAGDVDFLAHAGGNVSLQAGVFADEDATVSMGNVTVQADSTGGDTDSDGDLLFIAGAYDGASLHLASLAVTLDAAGASGAVFLGADSDRAGLPTRHDYPVNQQGADDGPKYFSGTGNNDGETEDVEIDALSLAAGSGANLSVWVDHMAYDESRTAALSGAGDITFMTDHPVYGVIDAGNLTGSLHFVEMLAGASGDADHAYTQVNQFDYTLIKGFDVSNDTIGFGNLQVDVGTWRDLVDDGGVKHDVDGLNYGFAGNVNLVHASASQFVSAGTFSNEGALFSALNTALDGNSLVVYAKYDGNLDLPGTANDVVAGDSNHDWYVVAYDGDGTGITAIALLQVAEGQTFGNANVGP